MYRPKDVCASTHAKIYDYTDTYIQKGRQADIHTYICTYIHGESYMHNTHRHSSLSTNMHAYIHVYKHKAYILAKRQMYM